MLSFFLPKKKSRGRFFKDSETKHYYYFLLSLLRSAKQRYLNSIFFVLVLKSSAMRVLGGAQIIDDGASSLFPHHDALAHSNCDSFYSCRLMFTHSLIQTL